MFPRDAGQDRPRRPHRRARVQGRGEDVDEDPTSQPGDDPRVGDRPANSPSDARAFFADMQAPARTQRSTDPRARSNLLTTCQKLLPAHLERHEQGARLYESLVAKSPLRGDRSFLHERKYGTIRTAANDLEPVTTNPAELRCSSCTRCEIREWLTSAPTCAGLPAQDGGAERPPEDSAASMTPRSATTRATTRCRTWRTSSTLPPPGSTLPG